MIPRALLFLSVLPLSALAQIQVFQFDGANETPVGAGTLVPIGTISPCDTLETRFRIRNPGAGPVDVATPKVNGNDYALSPGSFPSDSSYRLAPGSAVDFRVQFQPTGVATYPAFITVNTFTFTIQGTSVAAAVVKRTDTQETLCGGASTDFGSVTSGASSLRGFSLTNSGATTLTVNGVQVSPSIFRMPIPLPAPLQLTPGQTVSFQIAFEPQNGQPAQGTLSVDKRTFNLKGQGLDPPLPGASITLASTLGASAQQNSVSIPLASASQVSGTGTLTMEFQSAVAGVTEDPFIRFVSGSKDKATVTVSPGDSTAKFDGQPSLVFQTGTTAGTIVFTLTLNGTQQASASLTIAPSPVSVQTATVVRRIDALDVSITGFDNTYSASQLAFTFYNQAGQAMQPGTIRVDATSNFKNYFGASSTGGAFGLLATFPVMGDTTQIAAADVQITNSAGVVTAQRIHF
ncbi:MAG: hypothetical protein LAP38_27095 [Acidobacteriia bacterium]|nr:hypothetical protein [Terriglobia bacterium]